MSEKVEMPPIDKSAWGDGPWQTEPDKLNWIHAGMDCMIIRQPTAGHLCGYVGVPESHPAFGKESSDVDVRVHGGLTYSAECQGHICHLPEPGRPAKVWWLGFDCAHLGDIGPAERDYGDSTYKDIDYVKQETNRLAEQLHEAV